MNYYAAALIVLGIILIGLLIVGLASAIKERWDYYQARRRARIKTRKNYLTITRKHGKL